MGFGFRIPKKQNAEEIDVGHRCDIATWNCRVRRVTQTRLGIYEGSQNNCFSKLFLFIAWFLSEGSSGRGLTSALILAPKWFVSVTKLFVIELFIGRRLRADPSTGRLIGVKLRQPSRLHSKLLCLQQMRARRIIWLPVDFLHLVAILVGSKCLMLARSWKGLLPKADPIFVLHTFVV